MVKHLLCLGLCLWLEMYWSQADSTFKRWDTLSSIVPAFVTTGAEAESTLEQQDISPLLQSSRDAFTQFAGFQIASARYVSRGYSAQNQQVMINGISMANPETGRSAWSSWSGLNDVSRFVETAIGNTGNRYAFSGPGGYANIDSRASSLKKGTRVSYAVSNKLFRNRFMLTHSTGTMRNGWAVTASVSYRSGSEVYIPGTYFNAGSFYLAADKRINYKHSLSFTGFAAPVEQGLASTGTLEAYRLAGNYYNSLWGYQNGKVRNSAVSKTSRPVLMLSHHYARDKSSKLSTSVVYTYGRSSLSGINWNNAPNPHPDYYRYLPSYAYSNGQAAEGDRIAQQWLSDINTRQINWDRLIAMNRNNLFVLPSQLGQRIVTDETRARYIVEDRVENMKLLRLNTVYNKRINKTFLSAGLNSTLYTSRKYKVMNDLLGATYWLDYDQFAEALGVDDAYRQNDIEHADRKVHKGERFGYDYTISVYKAEAWTQLERSFRKVDVYGGLSLSESSTWREGFMANGKFPLNSKGRSAKASFFNYGIKAGITYKITGRHFITCNASLLSRPPMTANLFISPASRNTMVNGIGNERVVSGEISYLVKYATFNSRITYYNSVFSNLCRIRTYWNDAYNTMVNLVMKHADEHHQGLELGLEKTLMSLHNFSAAFGLGRFVYSNRPLLDAWQDNNNTTLFTDRVAYLKNYRTGTSPQLMAGIAYRYTAKKHWYASVSFNYVDQIYAEPNPDRRTAEALSKFVSNESPVYGSITAQERLPGYALVNASGGFSYRINRKYMLTIALMINNALNAKTHLVNGYEQLRWDAANPSRFGNKYSYMAGSTYNFSLNFNF